MEEIQIKENMPEQQLDVPYHPGVNPPLWEMGHSAFFYEVFVFNLLDGSPSYDPAMDDLWDSFHVDHKDRWRRDLFPGREETLTYFNAIYDRVAERIKSRELTERELYLYRYAIYHQNMHIESLIWCRQTVGYPAPADFSGDRPAPGEAITGDVEHVYHAVALDPLTGALLSLEQIRAMTGELLEAQAQWLPQFRL